MVERVEISEAPGDEERRAIFSALVDYNRANGPPTKAEPIAILIRNDDAAIGGGLWGPTLTRLHFVANRRHGARQEGSEQ